MRRRTSASLIRRGPCGIAFREGVVFEHVAFGYPGQTEPVLRDVSFTAASG